MSIKPVSFRISHLFRRKKRDSARSRSKAIYSSPDFSDSDWTFASCSSETLAYPVIRKTEIEIEGKGLYIRFASHASSDSASRPLSPTRAMRLKYRIANAVVKAGMAYGSETEAPDPLDSALKERGAVPPSPVSSLFRGTYGQVMEALQSAGLTTSICDESGFPNATRLGAMFVVNHSASANVELMKLTLWA